MFQRCHTRVLVWSVSETGVTVNLDECERVHVCACMYVCWFCCFFQCGAGRHVPHVDRRSVDEETKKRAVLQENSSSA